MTKSRADRAGQRIRTYLDAQGIGNDDPIENAERAVSQWRAEHAYPLSLVTPGVRNWVSQETAGPVVVGQRLKRFDRIAEKLRRFCTIRLSQVEDIAGCRAVLRTPIEVDAVARRIRTKWQVASESDYRDEGKKITGYRSLHIIVLRQGKLVEVQLRTVGEQLWAESVERTSSRTGHNLKDGLGPAALLEYFRVASEITALQERDLEVLRDLIEELANLRPQVAQFFRADAAPGPRVRN